jgi:toxin ParE1/3/4
MGFGSDARRLPRVADSRAYRCLTTLRNIQSPRAKKDIRGYYIHIGLRENGAAERFVDTVNRTFARLADQPNIGSTRLWSDPGLRGIRAWPVVGFNQFIVYNRCQAPDSIWIARVLRGSVPPEGVLRTPH